MAQNSTLIENIINVVRLEVVTHLFINIEIKLFKS
jgi:hypothetical protein